MTKIPDDVTLTLHQAKFPEITTGNIKNGGNYLVEFPLDENV